jgi:hypothetical protein
VILTSIDPGALRGDLADRLVRIELEEIPKEKRLLDAEVARRFAAARPRVLGALLSLLADVLRVLPSVELREAPRMADFARVVAAVDKVRGTKALRTYLKNNKSLVLDVIEGDEVAVAVTNLLNDATAGTWTGEPARLLAALRPAEPSAAWPRSAQALTGRLKRLAPALRAAGIEVERHEGPPRKVTLTPSKEGGLT